jgi:aspartate aminotransferase
MAIDLLPFVSSHALAVQESPTIGAARQAKELDEIHGDVLDLTAGEPCFKTPEHILEAMIAAARSGKTKYGPTPGNLPLRKAISDRYVHEHNLEYSPSQITVTAGTKSACALAIGVVVDPDNEVIIPQGSWGSYKEMVTDRGGKSVIAPTAEKNGFKLTPDVLEGSITRKTKMLILNTPVNPSGSVYTKDELGALCKVAVNKNILILFDEIYDKLLYDGAKHFNIAAFGPEVRERTFIANGPSKTYAMTGWRHGFLISPSEGLAGICNKIQSNCSTPPVTFCQDGALAAYKGPQDCVTEMLEGYRMRRQLAMEGIKEAGLECINPQGAFYVYAKVDNTGVSGEKFTDIALKNHHLAVVDGSGFENPDYVRISYAASLDAISEGMDRLERVVAEVRSLGSGVEEAQQLERGEKPLGRQGGRPIRPPLSGRPAGETQSYRRHGSGNPALLDHFGRTQR